MSLQEKSIDCFDCGVTFTFTLEEQQAFQAKGYNHAPKRCPTCRQSRKARQIESSKFRIPQLGFQSERRLFPAICARCGKSTQVPFEPQAGRQVFCRECYQGIKVTR